MKKSLIALAVAGALTAPIVAQADATLYGIAQFRLIDQDTKDLDAQMAKTRLGVKGTVDNDIEGLTTGYQVEWEFDANEAAGTAATSSDLVAVRKSLVYMKGDFGQVAFGRQNNPAEVMDLGYGGRNGGEFSRTTDRLGNAISYATLNRSGFELSGAVAMDASEGTEDVDASAIALTYNANGIGAALAYYDVEDSYEVTGAKLTYTAGDFTVGANYQEKEFETGTVDEEVFTVGGKYKFGKAAVYGEYQEIDVETGSANDNDHVLVGVSYALGSKAGLAAEYSSYDKDTGTYGRDDELVLQYTIGF